MDLQHLFRSDPEAVKAFQEASYFWFNMIDERRTVRLFQDVWPIESELDSDQYMDKAYSWLIELSRTPAFKRVTLRKRFLYRCEVKYVGKIIYALRRLGIESHERVKRKVEKSERRKYKDVPYKSDLWLAHYATFRQLKYKRYFEGPAPVREEAFMATWSIGTSKPVYLLR